MDHVGMFPLLDPVDQLLHHVLKRRVLAGDHGQCHLFHPLGRGGAGKGGGHVE